jgi:putative nucleotidyltransferase with HDIG domain
MYLLKNEKVVNIIENTLNFMDPRLVNHGKRVAYLVYRSLEPQNKLSAKEMRDVCLLTMLHDIGAYKTEEISRMTAFETADVWGHSVYGYLFLKYFSPLKALAPAILFHHADGAESSCLEPELRSLARLIVLCDRADIFSHYLPHSENFFKYLEKQRRGKFGSREIDIFEAAGVDLDSVDQSMENDRGFAEMLYNTPMSDREAEDFIKMIILSIDFRSAQTVSHTIAASRIAEVLAGLCGAGAEGAAKVKTGAMLHDIGKIGIPLNILESPGRLNDSDMATMKTHVSVTEKIIAGNVDDEIARIAVNHHEKLNGTGYPKGLYAADIALGDRALMIADIFSALCGVRSYKEAFPKEKVIGILGDLSGRGLIDGNITSLLTERFDELIGEMRVETAPVIQAYEALNAEYKTIMGRIKGGDFEGLAKSV